KYDNLYVRASVRVWDTVYRAKQSFRWPAKLTENDVYSEKIEITNINAELIKDINDLQNKIVKKHILPNEILTVESFSQEPIIKRGAQVKLMSKIGTVIVSTIGIAKDNGYKNQYVRVENINSNKTVRAKVIDSQTVIVE
ncbi:MAG TPA: flagellar basal body P-ring formation chaperone FlgA, partial [bacterium]|nr:flagellar basal body P-ring formation chaperone FlgA [bacterium]